MGHQGVAGGDTAAPTRAARRAPRSRSHPIDLHPDNDSHYQAADRRASPSWLDPPGMAIEVEGQTPARLPSACPRSWSDWSPIQISGELSSASDRLKKPAPFGDAKAGTAALMTKSEPHGVSSPVWSFQMRCPSDCLVDCGRCLASRPYPFGRAEACRGGRGSGRFLGAGDGGHGAEDCSGRHRLRVALGAQSGIARCRPGRGTSNWRGAARSRVGSVARPGRSAWRPRSRSNPRSRPGRCSRHRLRPCSTQMWSHFRNFGRPKWNLGESVGPWPSATRSSRSPQSGAASM